MHELREKIRNMTADEARNILDLGARNVPHDLSDKIGGDTELVRTILRQRLRQRD